MNIFHANALDWLHDSPMADLILTDPPHLDAYTNRETRVEQHAGFTKQWFDLAWSKINSGGGLVHSCGTSEEEVRNYLQLTRPPDQLLLWVHPTEWVHHYYFVHHMSRRSATTMFRIEKPSPFYQIMIELFSESDAMIVDPFCGRGEIPEQARASGRKWAGCDIRRESVVACWGKFL
jgi:hypothetical protein